MSLYDDPPLHDFPDRAIRRLLENPANLADVFDEMLPTLAGRFDCVRAEPANREFTLENWQHQELDLLFRVPFRIGSSEEWALVCVLLEHQSRVDPLMPLRLLIYAVLFWQRQWQAWASLPEPREPLRLSPVIPLVFHTGPTPWRQRGGLAELFDVPEEIREFLPQWPIRYWDITDHSPEELLASPRTWFQALTVVRAERAETEAFLNLLGAVAGKVQGAQGPDVVRYRELMWFLLSWALRRRPPSEKEAIMKTVLDSQTEANARQEAETISQAVTETWEQWMLKQGEARGLVQGQLLNSREMLRDLLQDRFGPLPETLVNRIEGITDLETLKRLVRQVAKLQALEDLAI